MYKLDAAFDIIKRFEGCSLKAYPDPATHGDPWTIGWGHTGSDVKPDTVWTQVQADQSLAAEIARVAHSIDHALKVTLTDNQFCACVSLVYNIGFANFSASTLLKDLNNSQFEAAANEFLCWNRAAGKVMAGLTTRREAERALFLS